VSAKRGIFKSRDVKRGEGGVLGAENPLMSIYE